jgi:two-component system CheB/CheR fusion protein
MINKKKILSTNLFPVIGIGASAGGLEAFKKLIKAIPEKSGMAYVLVQHLDPNHESNLPELLQKVTRIPVSEIAHDVKVVPDHIYIIPSNKMLQANDGVLELTPRPQKSPNNINLPIDLFFTSLAEVHQAHAIGVVLTGNASDGTLGLKAIKEHGGITFAQDKSSATYDSMPLHAAQAGVVDFILPPEEIPKKLLEIKQQITHRDEEQQERLGDEEIFKQTLLLLHIRKGTDFTYYKRPTIRRRIQRRMSLQKIMMPSHYLDYIRKSKSELDALYQDLLIPVTEFFRDKKVFDHLCSTAIPQVIKNRKGPVPIRFWVVACSTGQEAYSIAICLKEFLGKNAEAAKIFATDMSEPAIARARKGLYTKTEVKGITPLRLKNFFTEVEDGYLINKEIRDMCVFAVHNFLKDPPFGKVDFVSCRNVLIYLEPYLQKKALTTFHYALVPNGLLLLGKAETAGTVPELFDARDKVDKIFIRKNEISSFNHVPQQREEQRLQQLSLKSSDPVQTDFQKTADAIMLTNYTPAGVVVNEALEIVQFRGHTGQFLESASGKPSHHLLKMAKGDLSFELRTLLMNVRKQAATIRKENIVLQVGGAKQLITIEVIPLPKMEEPYYLILFQEQGIGDKHVTEKIDEKNVSVKKDENEVRITQLENELELSKEDLHSLIEVQEAANEDLQSSNEELLSGSEELQSLNEELEASKEELQSTNEELTSLYDEVMAARQFSESIVSTIRQPLVVLDKNLRIKTANNAFYKAFDLHKEVTEGVLIYDLGNKEWNLPELRMLLEEILPKKTNFTDFEITHHFKNLGNRTLLVNAHELKREKVEERLILLAIEDITVRVQHNLRTTELLNRFQNLVAQAPVAICILKGKNYLVELANSFYLKIIDKTDGIIGMPFFQSLPELKLQGIKKIIDNVWKSGKPFSSNEMELYFLKGEKKEKLFFNFVFQPIREQGNEVTHIIMIVTDVTQQVLSKNRNADIQKKYAMDLEENVQMRTAELREVNKLLLQKNKELESFNYISSHDLQEPLRKIQTYTDRIQLADHAVLTKGSKEHFAKINDAASRMRKLINDLLTYSHTNISDRKFDKIDLSKIFEEVRTDLLESILEKKATIKVAQLDVIKSNAFQFHQIFYNLLTNSLKFAKLGTSLKINVKSKIAIGAYFQKKDAELKCSNLLPTENYCCISFTDNVIGFKQLFKEKIFELFQRLHSREEYAGTGVGLAIVKKIVDNHKGFITAASIENKGCTFHIYIPA